MSLQTFLAWRRQQKVVVSILTKQQGRLMKSDVLMFMSCWKQWQQLCHRKSSDCKLLRQKVRNLNTNAIAVMVLRCVAEQKKWMQNTDLIVIYGDGGDWHCSFCFFVCVFWIVEPAYLESLEQLIYSFPSIWYYWISVSYVVHGCFVSLYPKNQSFWSQSLLCFSRVHS